MQPEGINEKIKRIAEEIKKRTAMPAYKLQLIKDKQPGVLDSKFGGVPYWDLEKDYPLDGEGQKMMMIAQINFTSANLKDECLPEQGMLQFFIGVDDDVFGMNFDEQDVQRNFRVVYHKKINEAITKEEIQALEIPICTDLENQEYTPVFKEVAVEIQKTTAYMDMRVVGFDKLFAEVIRELFNEEIEGQSLYEYLNAQEYDYLADELSTQGHRILGYPFFTQYDPREQATYYNTLLLQMDSDMIDREDYILWGDCGVANFFINSEALARKDFSKVLYNWDCY